MLIGADARGWPEMGQSTWLDVCHGRRAGLPPRVNLEAERRNGEFVRMLIGEGLVTAVHDVSDGGILVAVAEMALAGNIGARLVVETFEALVRGIESYMAAHPAERPWTCRIFVGTDGSRIFRGGVGHSQRDLA